MAFAMPAIPPFPHRHGLDGTHTTYTSICPKCFVVVLTAVNERELLHAELAHVCQARKPSSGYY